MTTTTLLDAYAGTGITIIPPCPTCPPEHTDTAEIAVTDHTPTGNTADTVNQLRGTTDALIDRAGRVWLLTHGATSGTYRITVERVDNTTVDLDDIIAAVTAVTEGRYAAAPKPKQRRSSSKKNDDTSESEPSTDAE